MAEPVHNSVTAMATGKPLLYYTSLNQRHDNIRDLLVCLINRVCPNMKQEPHLTHVTEETFSQLAPIIFFFFKG